MQTTTARGIVFAVSLRAYRSSRRPKRSSRTAVPGTHPRSTSQRGAKTCAATASAVKIVGWLMTSFAPTEMTSTSRARSCSTTTKSCGSSGAGRRRSRSVIVPNSTAAFTAANSGASTLLNAYATSSFIIGGSRTSSYPLIASAHSLIHNLLSSDESPARKTRSRGRSAATTASRCGTRWPRTSA